ncbi:triacylglycerol lipase [Vitiosangium sp. GDMCC 1.1324]|uniref:esterase/lipase family protein n=1 Tax=Vitiosangium sp. (strain GDMCC 1.1324) TaxID=2138576 RepID=UPI000D3A8ED6|nr:acetyltransferase [Vitiosangium sp. GDMCC 1.1324]PTL79675.1 acetyltransferase [Vitiosangium sp. GDMCC 1.1324]
MKKLHTLVLALCALGLTTEARAGAAKTTYPVVFAHGMAGFDDILGYDYWGDDYGMYVGDTCQLFEIGCNEDIDANQQSFVAQVQPFQNSEVRGLDLANDIEGYMASVGATRVNIIGHSQGGLDARKAAKVLYTRKGYTVVPVLVSVSSPHRGSPVAKYILDLKPGVTSVIAALAEIYGNVVNGPGNDAYAGAKQLVYNDYSASDGITTGAKAFNVNNPIDSRYASRYVSLLTAQNGLSVNPALFLVSELFYDIDGDGYCVDDCDNDGAAGKGDGIANEADDDGLVGINSQQMGYRLKYTESTFGFDSVTNDSNVAYLGTINAPTSAQMTSTSSVINQDHLDVVGVGPDTFDEPEFYAAIFNYIATYD